MDTNIKKVVKIIIGLVCLWTAGTIFSDYGIGINLGYTLAGIVMLFLGFGLIYYALVLQGKAHIIKR